jgi:Ca2+-binding EF-hand superfamily protein
VLDINRDGIISAEEISNAAESLKALDANGDGQLQPTEYRPRSAVIPGDDRAAPSDQPSDDQQLQDAIERLLAYDKNQDGQLDETEMPGRLKSIFTRADRDENGILTRREIIADARAAHSRARSDQFGPRPPASADNRPPAASGRMSLQQEAADAMLRRMDLDRNGLLGLNELPQTLRQRLTPWDMNQDQQLDLLELQKGLQADHRSFDRSQFHSPAAQE